MPDPNSNIYVLGGPLPQPAIPNFNSNTPAPTVSPGSATSHTVNVTINGQNTPVKVASADDAAAVARLMNQIALASNRAN